MATNKPFSPGLTGSGLKLIAIGCMLIDHIAWAFVDTLSPLGFGMHLIGRITAPVICFMLGEGYRHTRSFPRYLGRMAVFAVLSYLPFIYFLTGSLPDGNSFLSLNMLYTLTLCLLALRVDERLKGTDRNFALALLGILSLFGDWPVVALLYTLNFARNRQDFPRMVRNFAWITGGFVLVFGYQYWQMGMEPMEIWGNLAFQFGTFLALPFIRLYNGQKGRNIGGKWLFYFFYPVHLTLLALLRWGI